MLRLARRLTWREYFQFKYNKLDMNTEITKGIQRPPDSEYRIPRPIFFIDPVPTTPGPILDHIGYHDHVKGENILEWPELSNKTKHQYYHDGPESTTLNGLHIWTRDEIDEFEGFLRKNNNKFVN